ncbi:hypothetical protein ACFQ9J_21250 [Streptomyces sp. NPDC056529]|uniref:hypothetical protein n=1 Tax=Streptomyces sp. NPDC056529 TaxID=3345855 RepID=UPI0036BA6314
MSTTTGGFAAPRDAADAIVDEILRRCLAVEDVRPQGWRLRVRQDSPWPGRQDLAVPTEAESRSAPCSWRSRTSWTARPIPRRMCRSPCSAAS